jgi:conjugative relaxase-like TrwC/TraI family protein
MFKVTKGYSVGYLTGPVSTGREGYYTGAVAAGEPPGVWHGRGAEALGLAGEVDSDLMEAIYARLLDPRDEATHHREMWREARALAPAHRRYRSPEEIYKEALAEEPDAGPERRAELQAAAERKSQQAVAFWDATFSVPKSVTVLAVAFERAANTAAGAGRHEEAASWRAMLKAVEAAAMAGASASVDYLETNAYARVGNHSSGAGRWMEQKGFIVAQFLQHDSRDRDPQLHVHQAILNVHDRADGKWGRVDGAALTLHKWAAAAVGERVMEAELARTLGVRFVTRDARKDGIIREIAGVPQQVMDLFSKRSHAVTAKTDQLIREYEVQHGRQVSVLERQYIAERATLLTRKGKSHTGETAEQRLDRWEREARTKMVGGLEQVAHDVLALKGQGRADEVSPSQVIKTALWEVGKNEHVWTRSDLIFAISGALPANLGVPAADIPAMLERLADKALAEAKVIVAKESVDGLPAEFRLAGDLSAFQRPGSAQFATVGQIAEERITEQAAVRTGAAKLTQAEADAFIRRYNEAVDEPLGADKEAAIRGVLTSGAYVETISAAAGTGKSTTVGLIAGAWAEHGRRTFGLAASQNAADVMAEEGVEAFNFDRWRLAVENDDSLQLRAGDLVVVDEAGMASTRDMADLVQRCEEAGAKLLPVGDARQMRSVEAGGVFADLHRTARSYELTQVWRFQEEWERTASLLWREGDVAALDEYDKHGRLRGCGTTEQAEHKAGQAWLADTLVGKKSLLLVRSNDQAARVNAQLRAELVRLGKVAEQGVALGKENTVAGVGDLVQARHNHWNLFRGNTRPLINRQTYRVTEVLTDGGLKVENSKGVALTVPADYVEKHLTLGYASTLHAAQGRTVDTGHDLTGTYVGMTRGRESNTAWVTTKQLASDAPVGEAQEVEGRTAKAVLADSFKNAEEERGAIAQREQAIEDEKSTFRNVDRLLVGINNATAGDTSTRLDRLAAEGVITPEQREALAADRAMSAVERLLRNAEVSGHNPEGVLRDALEGKSLAGAERAAQVLHARIRNTLGKQIPRITSYRDLIPAGVSDVWRGWLEKQADKADKRRHELGARVAEERPPWAMETLGPVPEDPLRRAVWESRAGWAAASREGAEYTDEHDPLGPAPAAGLAEKRAIWATAHDALGLPDVGPEEAMQSDGQLLARAAAWEREQLWAPRYVADELAATSEQLADRRNQVGLWRAHAETLEGDEKRGVLEAAVKAEQEAAQLEQLKLNLEVADKERTAWFLHTAGTRDSGERAKAELARREVDLARPEDRTTMAEWLAAEEADRVAGDERRPIREEDLADEAVELPAPRRPLETAVADIRDVAVADPTEHDPRIRREVPSGDVVAESVRRARESLLERLSREHADEMRVAEEEAERQTRWLAAPELADEQARVRERA